MEGAPQCGAARSPAVGQTSLPERSKRAAWKGSSCPITCTGAGRTTIGDCGRQRNRVWGSNPMGSLVDASHVGRAGQHGSLDRFSSSAPSRSRAHRDGASRIIGSLQPLQAPPVQRAPDRQCESERDGRGIARQVRVPLKPVPEKSGSARISRWQLDRTVWSLLGEVTLQTGIVSSTASRVSGSVNTTRGRSVVPPPITTASTMRAFTKSCCSVLAEMTSDTRNAP